MKLFIQSFGCQANTADTEEMGRALKARGFEYTSQLETADAILINTCTVRQHAEDKAFSFVGTLREWKEVNPNRLLIVAGCAAERVKDTLQKRFPQIDLVVGAKSIEQFPQIIDEALKQKFNWEKDNKDLWPEEPLTLPSRISASGASSAESSANGPTRGEGKDKAVSAYVTIMRGCNYSCSYCIVPSVRGREIYRPAETILEEAHRLVDSGAKEIMLLGQTVNSYRYQDWGFPKLLNTLTAIEGLERLRFMSPHPFYFDDELIDTIADNPKICRHIHLPLQSGSNRMLKLMRRNYTREKYSAIVDKLRAKMPEIAITTDFIVGFPTETEEDFRQTLELAETIAFDGAYCFKFSPREGTEAETMDTQIPQTIKEERLAKLLETVDRVTTQRAKRWIGTNLEVLFESALEGRTQGNYRVALSDEGDSPGKNIEGKILSVEIIGAKNKKLYGRLSAVILR